MDPTIDQRLDNDAATRGIRVGSASPTTSVAIQTTLGGCGGRLWVEADAAYESSSGATESPIPVMCGASMVTVFDASQPGNPMLGQTSSRTDMNGSVGASPDVTLTPGSYIVRTEIDDGTLVGVVEDLLVCPGDDQPGPPDLWLHSEDIAFYIDPACETALSGNPYPGDSIAIAASIHYSGAEPLFDQPVAVSEILPIAGVLEEFIIGSATVSFPDGSGTATVCVPWVPASDGGRVVQVAVEPTIVQPQGNDVATRSITVGETTCGLELDPGIVSPLLAPSRRPGTRTPRN